MADFDPVILIYLLVLLIGIGSMFFGDFRNRLSHLAQQAAIWTLIFLSAVVLYGFKDTIEAQLYPSEAVEHAGGMIVLRKAPDGHFYANVELNGQAVNFMVDTGATQIVLSQADAALAGFDPERLRFNGQASTANGIVRTAAVRLDSVTLGSRTDRDVRAWVNGGELDTSLLGMSYLTRFSSFEFAGNELRLKP